MSLNLGAEIESSSIDSRVGNTKRGSIFFNSKSIICYDIKWSLETEVKEGEQSTILTSSIRNKIKSMNSKERSPITRLRLENMRIEFDSLKMKWLDCIRLSLRRIEWLIILRKNLFENGRMPKILQWVIWKAWWVIWRESKEMGETFLLACLRVLFKPGLADYLSKVIWDLKLKIVKREELISPNTEIFLWENFHKSIVSTKAKSRI